MKKMLVAGVILFLILAGAYIENKVTDSICSDLIADLEVIEEENRQGVDVSQRTSLLDAKWDKSKKILLCTSAHENTENIEVDIVLLDEYAKEKNAFLVNSTIAEIKNYIEHLQHTTKIKSTNIF